MFVHRAADGTETDVTEGVQALYDLVICSMDWGSGFLTYEDALPVVTIAELAAFPDAGRARKYVDDKKHSDEMTVFFSEHPELLDSFGRYPYGGGDWPQFPHDHVWSSVGRCMWRGCEVIA